MHTLLVQVCTSFCLHPSSCFRCQNGTKAAPLCIWPHNCFVASCTAGDLMTALLLANLYKDSSNMQHAVEQAIASLQAVLQASAEVSGPAAHSRERSAEVHIFLVTVLCFAFFIFCSLGSENVYGQISQCSPSDTCLCISTATRDHSITSSAGVQSKGVALDTEPAPYNVAAS